MGEGPDQIKVEIQEARNRLGQDLNELEYQVKSTVNWRTQFDRHPWTFVGAAFGCAMLLGLIAGRR